MHFFTRLRFTLWTGLFLAYISKIHCIGLSCYQCTVAPNPGAKVSASQICSHFDESQHFQTYCPHSTLCMKKSIRHRLGNGSLVLTSVERGCAPQLNVSKAYDFQKKSWYDTHEVVTSAYDERCYFGEDRGSPGGPPEYCFCSFHLCNGSVAKKIAYYLAWMSIVGVFSMQSIIL
ncbi:uncharacterized protein [Venturia canescens]|uniref:uncharacterized protein n=1 Tax=Venturia canescens TaxID=32260 RepID=UPI001C9BFE16|nr:uncharacterized protein LOC122407093 [Venturia canescens]